MQTVVYSTLTFINHLLFKTEVLKKRKSQIAWEENRLFFQEYNYKHFQLYVWPQIKNVYKKIIIIYGHADGKDLFRSKPNVTQVPRI